MNVVLSTTVRDTAFTVLNESILESISAVSPVVKPCGSMVVTVAVLPLLAKVAIRIVPKIFLSTNQRC